MTPANVPDTTYITVYRCCFETAAEQTLEFEFSADNRAQLYLDGKLLINGPERGAPQHWYFQRVKTQVSAGSHILTSRVVSLNPLDITVREYGYAQMTVRHGFYVNDKSGLLNNWEYQFENIAAFEKPFPDWASFPRVRITPDYNSKLLRSRLLNLNSVRTTVPSFILTANCLSTDLNAGLRSTGIFNVLKPKFLQAVTF